LLATALCVLSTTFAAHATEVTLNGDTYVSVSRSTGNFGVLSNLYVGNGNTALLQFNLSSLPAGTASNQIAKHRNTQMGEMTPKAKDPRYLTPRLAVQTPI
jgi:hypothetical protein